MMKVFDGNRQHIAQVDECGVLLIGLDGFTVEDLAREYPNVHVGIHVKDGDKWVPVKLDEVRKYQKSNEDEPMSDYTEMNEYFADRCNVATYKSDIFQIPQSSWMYNDIQYDFKWDIRDARCMAIVRSECKIQTELHDLGYWTASVYSDYEVYITGEGKTPDAAELVCCDFIHNWSD